MTLSTQQDNDTRHVLVDRYSNPAIIRPFNTMQKSCTQPYNEGGYSFLFTL